MVSLVTESSVLLKWETPALMGSVPNISYNVTYKADGMEMQTVTTSVNSINLSDLSSGTLYNITVVTVGAQNLTSTPVHKSIITSKLIYIFLLFEEIFKYYICAENDRIETSVTVLCHILAAVPKAVGNLTVRGVNTTAVQLGWDKPLGRFSHYVVTAREQSTVVHNDTTTDGNYTFVNLTSGTLYDFQVLAVEMGVKSKANNVSSETSESKPHRSPGSKQWRSL